MNFSRQRQAILTELRSRTDHPTAEEIYTALKPKQPNLSLGTVYRNIGVLRAAGYLQEIPSSASSHFDGNIKPHMHITCAKCGNVYDLNAPTDPDLHSNLLAQAGSVYPGEVIDVSVTFRGVCPACVANSNTVAATIVPLDF